jgi:hypothetical protein
MINRVCGVILSLSGWEDRGIVYKATRNAAAVMGGTSGVLQS